MSSTRSSQLATKVNRGYGWRQDMSRNLTSTQQPRTTACTLSAATSTALSLAELLVDICGTEVSVLIRRPRTKLYHVERLSGRSRAGTCSVHSHFCQMSALLDTKDALFGEQFRIPNFINVERSTSDGILNVSRFCGRLQPGSWTGVR